MKERLSLTPGTTRFTARRLENEDDKVNTRDERIPSTNPGAEPPRDARDSSSARTHSMHLETSSSDRP